MRATDYMMCVFLVALMIIPFILFALNNGTILISRPFYDDYKDCQKQLEKNVICPEVKCNCGSAGIAYTIFGIMFGLIGYGMYFYALHKVKKLERSKK